MRRAAILAAGLLALSASGCGGIVDYGRCGSSGATLFVFAASSLGEAFSAIGHRFEAADPDACVEFNLGPSDGLAQQIDAQGAADVFASASPAWMDDVQAHVGVSDRTDFARNRLVIVTPPDDPGHVVSIEDLGAPGVVLVLAAPGVPVGDYARQMLRNAGLLERASANVASNEQDDASLVQKVVSGDADAAVVYASDVSRAVAPKVRVVPIPARVNVTATYPIAVVAGASHPELARAFVDLVSGATGQEILGRFGFLPPG